MYSEKLKNKKILVTGGAGFIGSNLCDFLTQNGALVYCLDNFSTGSKKNIDHLINSRNFYLIEGDIRDLKTCELACKNIDFVLHHAALGSVPRSIKNPIETNSVNISGFLNMLLASKNNNVSRFIYAASSSTYGDSEILPKVEDIIGNPLSQYAITKYVNELYANNFKLVHNLDSIGLRYFNVFGKRQSPEGEYAAVIPKFINKLINNESPVIYGDGSNSRDFTYIDNVIQINFKAMFTKNKNALNQIYNVAVGERTSLIKLIKEIKFQLSFYKKDVDDIDLIFDKPRDGDVLHSQASINKAFKLLQYKPTHNLSDGLKDSIKWYIENL